MPTELRELLIRVRRIIARFRRPIAAGLAGVAALAVVDAARPPPPATDPVVVAAHDLDSGAVLGPADVLTADYPSGIVPGDAIATKAGAIGRLLAAPIRAGEPLTDRRLLGASLVASFGPGLVAAPVRIHDAGSVAIVQVGDRVDVFAARDESGAAGAAEQIVSSARVIALPRGGDSRDGGLVVLAVDPDRAAALAAASAVAPLSLALLPPGPGRSP